MIIHSMQHNLVFPSERNVMFFVPGMYSVSAAVTIGIVANNIMARVAIIVDVNETDFMVGV